MAFTFNPVQVSRAKIKILVGDPNNVTLLSIVTGSKGRPTVNYAEVLPFVGDPPAVTQAQIETFYVNASLATP